MSRSEGILKVLFVSESYPPESYGGGELSCALLASKLAECKGIEVTVLTSEVEGCPTLERNKGVTILRKLKTGGGRATLWDNLKRKMYFKRSVRRQLGRIVEEYDIVHFFNLTSIVKVDKPSFATINSYINFCPKGNLFYKDKEVCQGCSPVKFIGCITHSEYIGGHRLRTPFKYNPLFWLPLYIDFLKRKKDIQKVDRFFSLSDFINGLLIKEGVKKSKISKVVNISDIAESDDKMDLDQEGVLLVYIGELSNIKGVDLLIKAFNRLNTDSRLLIVGDGPEREKLTNLAGPSVDFLGRVDHDAVHSIYRQADVVVVPSLWPEPLSRVLLEAAHFGTPIVATRVGGSPEIVKDGYNGLLVDPEVEDMVQKLKNIIEDHGERDVMAENMKTFYRRKLCSERIVNDIVEVYEEELEGVRS